MIHKLYGNLKNNKSNIKNHNKNLKINHFNSTHAMARQTLRGELLKCKIKNEPVKFYLKYAIQIKKAGGYIGKI